MCLGKALGGGVDADRRAARLRARARRLRRRPDRQHLGLAARARARRRSRRSTLFEREPVLENVRALEARRRDEARRAAPSASTQIGDVRAVGCFQAIEFVRDRETKERDPELQDAPGAEALPARRASPTRAPTSLNIQPSLVMPADALDARLRHHRRGDRGGDRGARTVSDAATSASSARGARRRWRAAGTLKTIPVLTLAAGAGGRAARAAARSCASARTTTSASPTIPTCPRPAPRRSTRYGAGTASVRFICGQFEPHLELERDLAAFLDTEAALTYVSCWNANAALLDALCDARHGGLLRRAQPRLDHRRDPPRAARPQGGLRARRRRRPAPRARRRARDRRGAADRHRRRLQHGGRPGAARRSSSTVAAEHGATLIVDDSHGLGVARRDRARGPPSTSGPRRGRRRHHHRDARQGARRRAPGGFVAGGAALCEVLEQRSRPQLFSNGLAADRGRQLAPRARRASRRPRPGRPAPREHVAACARACATPASSPLDGRERDRADHRRRDRRGDRRSAAACSTTASTSPASATRWCPRARRGSGFRCRPRSARPRSRPRWRPSRRWWPRPRSPARRPPGDGREHLRALDDLVDVDVLLRQVRGAEVARARRPPPRRPRSRPCCGRRSRPGPRSDRAPRRRPPSSPRPARPRAASPAGVSKGSVISTTSTPAPSSAARASSAREGRVAVLAGDDPRLQLEAAQVRHGVELRAAADRPDLGRDAPSSGWVCASRPRRRQRRDHLDGCVDRVLAVVGERPVR